MAPEVARKKTQAVLVEMAEGHNPNAARRGPDPDSVTLDGAFQSFFEARAHLSVHTVDGYTRSWQFYLKAWRKRPLREITRQEVLAMHRRITEHHGGSTANNVFRYLRSVFNFIAAMYDDFPPNPVQILTQARAWHREIRRRTLIPAHLLPAWWQAVEQEPEYSRDFLRIGLFTGMRRAEIARLRWENIDLERRLLHIPVTKNGDPFDLPLSDYLTDLLRERRARVPGSELNVPRSEFVFPGIGEKKYLVEVKRFLDRVEAASGVKFTTHDLRRTFITIAESLDIPHYALKRLLNHRADSDVTGGYIVINAERLREPVERIAERILELADAERPDL